MSRQAVLYVVLAVIVIGAGVVIDRVRFRHYWQRNCTGRLWKSAFPSASASEIRRFLSLFVSAFYFSERKMLKFEPSDRIMDIYRTRHPSNLSPDDFELESLAKAIKDRYGVDLVPIWNPAITLAELFERTARRVA